jgi:hypothetical protein
VLVLILALRPETESALSPAPLSAAQLPLVLVVLLGLRLETESASSPAPLPVV